MEKLKKALEKAGDQLGEIKEERKPSFIPREEIAPVYTRTRVVKVDREHLRRHKIFSFFHEDQMAEQLKILRTRILNALEDLGGNTLLITSPHPGEGKTLTALNLAISMAQEFDRTVLLVDANLKDPAVHTYLGINPDLGLAHVLLREAEIPDVLINPDIPRLVIMPAGKTISGSAELLGSPYAESVFREIKDRYPERLIIFDSPSVLHAADPLVLAEYADAVLLLAEAERTPADDLRQVVDLLKDKPLIGVVLNKMRF